MFATSFPFFLIESKHFFMSKVQQVIRKRYRPASGTLNSPDFGFIALPMLTVQPGFVKMHL
jgi:hypothetical protein